MKLKYLQSEFGGCVYYCWANIFDDGELLHNMKLGAHHVDARRIVEKQIPGNTLIHLALHSETMFPITSFEFPKPVEKDQYCCYTIVVESNRLGYRHYIFALIDCYNEMTLFDPYIDEGVRMAPKDLFNRYAVYEIETICSDSGTMYFVFNKQDFRHLEM